MSDKTEVLTKLQAYCSLYGLLEQCYWATKDDHIGALLGSLSLVVGGSPVDPGMEDETGGEEGNPWRVFPYPKMFARAVSSALTPVPKRLWRSARSA